MRLQRTGLLVRFVNFRENVEVRSMGISDVVEIGTLRR